MDCLVLPVWAAGRFVVCAHAKQASNNPAKNSETKHRFIVFKKIHAIRGQGQPLLQPSVPALRETRHPMILPQETADFEGAHSLENEDFPSH